MHAFTVVTGSGATERPLQLASLSLPKNFEAWIAAPGRGLKQRLLPDMPGFLPAPGGDTLLVAMGTPNALQKSGLLRGQREGVPGFGLRLVRQGRGFTVFLDLPAEAALQARLVDVRGKSAATLSTRRLGAGHHAISLERNFESKTLGRGIYFLQIRHHGHGMPEQSVLRVSIAD